MYVPVKLEQIPGDFLKAETISTNDCHQNGPNLIPSWSKFNLKNPCFRKF